MAILKRHFDKSKSWSLKSVLSPGTNGKDTSLYAPTGVFYLYSTYYGKKPKNVRTVSVYAFSGYRPHLGLLNKMGSLHRDY